MKSERIDINPKTLIKHFPENQRKRKRDSGKVFGKVANQETSIHADISL